MRNQAMRNAGRVLALLRRDRRGITAVEYGLIASALAFTLVGIFTNLGTPLSVIFQKVSVSI